MFESPIRNRRAERHEATRSEILDAAWELARTEGLAGLSLRDVARLVGMQAPSLYSYFDSKHAIYDAMFAQGAQAYLDRDRQLAATGEPKRDLKAAMRLYVEFCTEDSARYQLLFQRTIPGFEPSPESYAIAVECLQATGARLAKIGIETPRALDLLTAMWNGFADQQISNDPGGDRWLRLVDDAMEMFFDHVTKPKTAKRRTRP